MTPKEPLPILCSNLYLPPTIVCVVAICYAGIIANVLIKLLYCSQANYLK